MVSTDTIHAVLMALTNFGESVVLGAMVIGVGFYLFAIKRRADAVSLFFAYGGASVLAAILKVAFIGCGHNVLAIRSPSGHTALSFAVLGMFAVILWGNRPSEKILSILFGCLALAIGISRVILHFHTASEMVVGALIGAGSVFFSWLVTRRYKESVGTRQPVNIPILAAILVVAIFLTYGAHIPAEPVVNGWGFQLRQELSFCR